LYGGKRYQVPNFFDFGVTKRKIYTLILMSAKITSGPSAPFSFAGFTCDLIVKERSVLFQENFERRVRFILDDFL